MTLHKSLILALLLTFFATTTVINAQDIATSLKKANSLYKDEHFRNAIPFYEEVLKAEPDNAEALFKSGVCYLNRFSKEKALNNILKAFEKDSSTNKHIRYWMGRAYHLNYKFDEAITCYSIYKDGLRKKDQRSEDLRLHLAQTLEAKKQFESPKNYLVRNLSGNINSSFSDHSPVISQDGNTLYFTSRRENTEDELEELDGEPFEDIFFSKRVDSATWSKPESIHLNTTGHDASCQLYDNDTKMIIYKFHKGGDIYHTDKEGDKWGEPVPFANINTKRFESSAFVTSDGKTAYFSSNKYKKNDDLDIYYITKDDKGNWSKIQELKGPINTKFDEEAPYLTDDNKTMYFSSRGLSNMGGFDIFKSTVDANGVWSEPENVGYPVNTPDDDVYYYLNANGKRGYLASYRGDGLGEKDIYEIIPIKGINIQGLVTEDVTGNKVNDIKVVFSPITKTTGVSDISKNDGQYGVKLTSNNKFNVALLKGVDTLKTEILDVPVSDDDNNVMTKNFVIPYVKPIEDSSITATADTTIKTIKTNPTLTQTKQYVIKDTYYPTGKSTISDKAKDELNSLVTILVGDPSIKVQLVGHTDDIGSDVFNQKLSEARAKSAMNYLIKKGIAANRLSAKGFGETMPIVPNDSDTNRALNRRTEAKIVAK